jgi:hypothetical protein
VPASAPSGAGVRHATSAFTARMQGARTVNDSLTVVASGIGIEQTFHGCIRCIVLKDLHVTFIVAECR